MNAPHVAPPAAPARPPAPRPAAARPGPKPDDGGGLRVLTYLRLHWLMILFCGTLLGAGGAFAAWEVLASRYESYAMLQVSSVPDTLANPGNKDQARTDFVTYVKTQVNLLKSEFVLNAALRDLADSPTIKAQKDPIKFLDEELQVVWADGSQVVKVVFKGHEPADARRIVDAVVGAYLKEVVYKDVLAKQQLRDQVGVAREKFRVTLDRMSLAKDKPAAGSVVPAGGPPKDAAPAPAPLPPLAVGGGLPGVVPGPPAGGPALPDALVRQNPGILFARMTGLIDQAERLPLSIADIQSQLAVLKKNMDAIRDAPVSKLTRDAVEKDPEVMAQVLAWQKARAEYQTQASTSRNPEAAPAVVKLKLIVDAREARLGQLRREKEELIEGALRRAAADKVAAEMQGLFNTLRRQEEQLAAVRTQLARAERQLADLPAPADKGVVQAGGREAAPYQPEASVVEMTDSIYRRLVQQYHLIEMELASPARVTSLQAASTPTQKDTKKQLMGTVFAGLLGFGLMAAGAVGFETVTRRVSSLADVKGAAAGCPVVGVVPCPAGGAEMTAGEQAAAGEAVDKLRAYVAQAWLSRGATTVAVTSPVGDEGKAFAAHGLAASLAQSGYKTLLADFDLRAPQLHALAGVPNGVGACEVLRGEADARSAVQALPTGLHLLTAGAWSDDARRAATGERLEALLAKLKGPYDCVVVHGHALLTAAEAVEVARRCEVVLVCARYRETTTPLLKKAAERVAAMEIPYSGVVYVGATETEALC
ncbi:MAG: hypothetical protein C0501_29955 [Isosphaera sp.]|nr:hypothetical protein [Isosphaera sp.]